MSSEPQVECEEIGPKMAALNERERNFVWNYLINGGNGAKAARDAGYSDASEGAKVRAHWLMHSDRVLEAMHEVAAQTKRGLVLLATIKLGRMLANEKHKHHAKAVEMVVGAPATEHQHLHVHVDGGALGRISKLAQELGVDATKLLGVNHAEPVTIEGKAVADE